jgi:hypothetical protein
VSNVYRIIYEEAQKSVEKRVYNEKPYGSLVGKEEVGYNAIVSEINNLTNEEFLYQISEAIEERISIFKDK